MWALMQTMPAGLLLEWEAYMVTVLEDQRNAELEAKAVARMRR